MPTKRRRRPPTVRAPLDDGLRWHLVTSGWPDRDACADGKWLASWITPPDEKRRLWRMHGTELLAEAKDKGWRRGTREACPWQDEPPAVGHNGTGRHSEPRSARPRNETTNGGQTP